MSQESRLKLEPHFSKRLDLSIRLANSQEEVRVAQRLRYLVFHVELGAKLLGTAPSDHVDADAYDPICDHLLVIRSRTSESNVELCVFDGEVVGTYRLLRQTFAEAHNGFYSQGEFDLAPLLARKSELSFLELGRSCVMPAYRGTPVIELLWQGIWNYVRFHKCDVMIGCASFEGTDPDMHADTLSFLGYHTKPPAEWHVRAHAAQYVNMERKPESQIDSRRAMLALPPLIKGYLRLGSYIGEGAVIDHAFNTIDVLIILPVSKINPRYFAHFGAPTN